MRTFAGTALQKSRKEPHSPGARLARARDVPAGSNGTRCALLVNRASERANGGERKIGKQYDVGAPGPMSVPTSPPARVHMGAHCQLKKGGL